VHLKDFILPLVALFGGIVSLFIDSKDVTKRWLFILGLTTTAAVTIIFNYREGQEKESERNVAVAAEKARADNLKSALDALIAKVESTPAKIIDALRQFGFTRDSAKAATPQEIELAIAADRKYEESLSRGIKFADVAVEYYPKGQDGEKVRLAIENLGLRVSIATPKNTSPTNAIWVGPTVPDEAVKSVAYALLRAGAKIADIRRIPSPQGNRNKLIQIGSEPALVNSPTMSLDRVDSFSNARLK
jgi:hypothetical protein